MRALNMMIHEQEGGFSVTFDNTDGALAEIQLFFKKTWKVTIPLTLKEFCMSRSRGSWCEASQSINLEER
jgi:hypothetical protein